MPDRLYELVRRACDEQDSTVEIIIERSLDVPAASRVNVEGDMLSLTIDVTDALAASIDEEAFVEWFREKLADRAGDGS
jgi:hypothetical protein